MVLFNVLTVNRMVLFYLSKLLVSLLNEYDHVAVLVLTPLGHGCLEPELLVRSDSFGRGSLLSFI